MYIRSEKLKRAKQLGIEYPIQPLSHKIDEELVDMEHYYAITTHLEQSHKIGADALELFYGKDAVLVSLSDGASGVSGSQEASTYVMRWFNENKKKLENALTVELLENYVLELDKEMYRASHVGESTLVFVAITESQIMGVSVGDSACWMFGKEFEHELTLMQHRKPLLGTGKAQPIGFCMEMMGDVIVASDGLFDYVSIKEIKAILAQKETTSEMLVELAKKSSGNLQDDISVILVRR